MARTRIEDKGFESLRSAGKDPVGAFFLRIIGPGVRQEVSRVKARIEGVLDNVSEVFLEAEGKRKTPRGAQVIDAEIVEETRAREKK